MYTPSILIVEDDEALRGELVELLRALGAVAVGVADGEDAMHASLGQAFDLVLCDYKLSAESGLDVLASLAAQPLAPVASNLYLMTAHLDLTRSDQDQRFGAMGGLLHKPIGAGVLRRLVAGAADAEARRC